MQRLECRQPAHARPTVLLSPHAPIAPCKLCTRKNTVFCNSVAEHAVQAVTTHVPQIAVPAAAAIAVLVGPAVVEAVAAELQPKKCKVCLGTGFLICSQCQGRGKLGLSLPGAAALVSPCTNCNKRGRCKCSQCKATGLENNWLWQPAADPGWGPRGN